MHLKPNSRELLVKYTNHKYEQMNFMSKHYIQNINLENKNKDVSNYPCIDPFIDEFYSNVKLAENFLIELKYSVGFLGYTISLNSI